jgi:hypothetical protein
MSTERNRAWIINIPKVTTNYATQPDTLWLGRFRALEETALRRKQQ